MAQQAIDNGFLSILTVRHETDPKTGKEFTITNHLEDSSMRYKKGMADVDWFDPKDTPALLRAFRGTGEKITFPIDDDHKSCMDQAVFPERIRAILLSKNKDSCVVDAAVKIYMDTSEYITSQMENACTEYLADPDHTTGQKNEDTALDRRVEGPCDLLWIDVRSLAAMTDADLTKLVDKVLQLALVA